MRKHVQTNDRPLRMVIVPAANHARRRGSRLGNASFGICVGRCGEGRGRNKPGMSRKVNKMTSLRLDQGFWLSSRQKAETRGGKTERSGSVDPASVSAARAEHRVWSLNMHEFHLICKAMHWIPMLVRRNPALSANLIGCASMSYSVVTVGTRLDDELLKGRGAN